MPRRSGSASSVFQPQLAQLVQDAPSGPGWVHEVKLDGYRIGCLLERGRAQLISRNGIDWTDRFPEIRDAAERLQVRRALLDGEVAITDAKGRTSFQALQNAFGGRTRSSLTYFVFDLLRLNGEDVAALPLLERKARLERLLRGVRPPLALSAQLEGDGPRVLAEACRLGLEGIVSKRADAAYEPGRGGGWLKTKCVSRQELVIGGFTDPEGAREGLGALLVGHYDAGRFVFAGRVGTGFTQRSARALRDRLEKLEIASCPFSPAPRGWLGRHAHWVEPRLVAEVAFTEWTDDGRIRHPSFQGLREDKRASDVTRETPRERSARRRRPGRGEGSEARAMPSGSERAVVAGVALSHPGRVLYPETGLTKLGLAAYYEHVADAILPHVRGRPLTLVRCPTGRDAGCFYMKHSKVWSPPAVRRVLIPEKAKTGEYLVVDTLPALVSLVQMNVLEIHTWNSRVDHLEEPDRLVFDIDPGPEVGWTAVVAAARALRALLRAARLESFVKTTGGRGLHVVTPIEPSADWTECLAFARAIAEAMERAEPARYTTAFRKAGRERKILIDYLRNNRTNTSVAAFSTRARPGAPVSTPLDWRDLRPTLDPAVFTVASVPARLRRRRRDPWADYWTTRQPLRRDAVAALERL